ncbi:membrane protein insertion efficiency factor YidD [Candidatus Aerophobetes bacterium]|nr:membrane protein insertion efficiency factor YidD [Candidatus Aerophobetes bacterium]
MAKKIVKGLITLYKNLISPWLPSVCRFYPTCSEYTFQAVDRYGVKRGVFLGTKRIVKCHPFHPGGHDPLT